MAKSQHLESPEFRYNSAFWNGVADKGRGTFRPAGILNPSHHTHYDKIYDAGYRAGHNNYETMPANAYREIFKAK